MPSSSSRANVRDAHFERGKALRRPHVPPQLARILDEAGVHQHAHMALILAPAVELLGQPGARQLVEHGDAVGHEAGVGAAPEGRGGRKCEQMRKHIAHLAHEVDAQVVVRDPDVDMHAADDETPAHALEVAREGLVARLGGRTLAPPMGEGMGRGGHDGKAMALRDLGDRTPQMGKLAPRLAER